METLITEGVKVSVETFYLENDSDVGQGVYRYAYRITIENLGNTPIQLLRRHWIICNGDGIIREVKGDGVVGEQPILSPAESYQYVSGTEFYTTIGRMYGAYEMVNLANRKLFQVRIPKFNMVAPFQLN